MDHLILLDEALERRATDVHVDPTKKGYQVRLRVDGELSLLSKETRQGGEKLVNQFKTAAGIEPGAVFTPRGVRRTFRREERTVDCRITLVPCVSGPKLAVRLHDPLMVLQSIGELGMDHHGQENMRRWLRELNGMVLVSGPTASGKTTTLYALLHELAEKSRHVVTIEDPAEYEIDGINQMQVDLRHGLDFEAGMSAILRLDPDLAMLGELREGKAAAVAISAAVAGHVLLTCLHARDAVSAVTALRNFGIENHQLAAALGVVVNQRLVRKLCTACRKESSLSAAQLEWFRQAKIEPPKRAWIATGCEACASKGFLGRTGLFEVWNLDEADYELALHGADEEAFRDKLREEGHATLWHHAAAKIDEGVTSFAEVERLGLSLPWQLAGR